MVEIRDMLYPQQVNLKAYMDEKKEILNISDPIQNSEKYKEIPWVYDGELSKSRDNKFKYPSITHSYKLYKGLCFLLGVNDQLEDKELVKCFLDEKQKDSVKEIVIKSIEKANGNNKENDLAAIECLLNEVKPLSKIDEEEVGKFSLIKGSIYKIKRYFLEDNNIRAIRGGSIIIDYLNNGFIKEFLESTEGLDSSCLIYSGGGNILMMVPRNKAQMVCASLEKAYQEYGLTIMSAFESIDTDVYHFFFDYKKQMGRLDSKLKEREKVRVFDYERSHSNINEIRFNPNDAPISLIGKKIDTHKICQLCGCRDANYVLDSKNDSSRFACASCYRKYVVGVKGQSKFAKEYKQILQKKNVWVEGKVVRTLDDIQDPNGMMAVMYGDGNNMGQYIMNILAPFEMMYFSDKTDQITKESVYYAISETMGADAVFEILAVGGDDLFFIVPAEYAPSLAVKVVEHFDEKFQHQATMSIGICIAKYHTPVKAMFEIARDNLKQAKKYAKRVREIENTRNIEDEGTIDIIELSGAQDVINDESYDGIFPMKASTLKRAIEKIGDMESFKLRMTEYNYAKKTMQKDEYNLYFNYKEAQLIKQGKQKGTRAILGEIFQNEFGNQYLQEHNPWGELIMLMKYGKGIEDAKDSFES